MVDTAKIQARIAARELLSLAEDDSPEFWQGIIDEARKHLPPEPQATSSREAMSDQEARQFGRHFNFPRGMYHNQPVDHAPLDYIEWWLNQDEFTRELQRYYNSPRVQAELRSNEQ